MNIKNGAKITFFLGLAIVLGVSLAHSKPKSTAKTAQVKLPIPMTNGWYTLGGLFDLINTNNPLKNSNFLVLINEVAKSASTAGLTSEYITANKTAMVQLLADTKRIDELATMGSLTTITKPYYQKLLLYFMIPGSQNKFYLNDPAPGKVAGTTKKQVNPALNIINKWDFTKYIPSMK